MREDMSILRSSKDILVHDNREILFCNYRLNHFTIKSLIRLSKSVIIPKNISKFIFFPCVDCIFGKPHNRPWRTKVSNSGVPIRKPSETRPGSMTSVDQMIYVQPGLISQINGALTHVRLITYTVFVDH